MIELDSMTMDTFRQQPLVVEGESKEIREHPEDPEKVLIWLKPTIYSFTENRCAWVEGSNLLRARAMKIIVPLLQSKGIDHAYQDISDVTGLISARKIHPSEDPNVEVIVKRFNSGTSYHRYYGMAAKPTRGSHKLWPGEVVGKYEPYRGPKIRFDWRNPFWIPELVMKLRKTNPLLPAEVYKWPDELRQGIMMRDEVLGEDFASELIDTKQARKTALWTYAVLQNYMGERNIVIYDMCLFITSDGKTVYGEINQDSGRFRHLDYGMLDKDVWRAGGSIGDVLEKWQMLTVMLQE